MNSKTKTLTTVAMLCAVSYVIMLVGRVPAVLFLKYDPKDVIVTLGGLIFGPMISFVISVIVSLIEMVTASDTGVIGLIMNIISTCSFACTAAFVYKRKRTISGAVISLVLGTTAMVISMLLWNYLVTPLYMKIAREEIAGMLLTIFLPFNLLKGGLNSSFTFLLYKPVITTLRKSGLVDTTNRTPAKTKKTEVLGYSILAIIIIITGILFILSQNNII